MRTGVIVEGSPLGLGYPGNQSGVGNPLPRRKAGLNSLD